ncbi:MerR family transcriptional regulator [Streptomyces axinellae]|uniref:HTH merR-type domain-containing protein n=1 Tax=Streptomyces axinellae TaxID=552788 RepID=A0ABN3PY80_9ACTN
MGVVKRTRRRTWATGTLAESPGVHSVGQVAGFAGVTVRTPHHYDEVGLLRPGRRTAAGVPADAPGAMDLAEEHRGFISRTSWECGCEMHRGQGEMYVADERFTAAYEAIRPGLAASMRDAIAADAARAARAG